MDAADSLAHGHGLQVRDEPYVFAVLYPILLAPLLAIFDRDVAYEAAKLMNALAFALAAVPIYLLARRLLSPWPSVGVSALSIAIPSAMYASVLMTESVPISSRARPCCDRARAREATVTRQVAALALIGMATLVRAQFVVLYPVLVVSLVAVPYLVGRRPAFRHLVRGIWPTLCRPRRSGRDRASSSHDRWDLLGAYAVLWRDTHRSTSADTRSTSSRTSGCISPSSRSWCSDRRLRSSPAPGQAPNARLPSRRCSSPSTCPRHDVAAFDSFLGQYLHDRYLFYLAPLWLIVLFYWFATVRHVRASRDLRICLALLVARAAVRAGPVQGHWRFHALGSASPTEINQALGSTTATRVVLVMATLVLALAVLYSPHGVANRPQRDRLRLLAERNAAWATAHDPVRGPRIRRNGGQAVGRPQVPADASVTMLLVSCARAVPTERWQVTANSISVTEFFNSSSAGVHSEAATRDRATAPAGRFGRLRRLGSAGHRRTSSLSPACLFGSEARTGTRAVVLCAPKRPPRGGRVRSQQLRRQVCGAPKSRDLAGRGEEGVRRGPVGCAPRERPRLARCRSGGEPAEPVAGVTEVVAGPEREPRAAAPV